MIRKFTYQILIVFFFSIPAFSEGTKEMMPSSIDKGFLQIYDRGRLFATYNCPVENRLNIHICQAGEKIYFGFNQPDGDVYFRLKDPSGTVVMGPTLIPTSGTGFITDYNSAVAGPKQIVGTSGYDAFAYTSLTSGDYYIEFNPASATTVTKSQRIFDFYDITVVNSANVIKPGRLWSYIWDINTKNDSNPFKGKMYIYSKDSIVTSVDFNGIQPHGAAICANSHGCANTGDIAADRASRVGDVTYPEFKIFLNDPDIECYPTGTFGSFTQATTITGCDPDNRCINIFVSKAGNVEILIDVNGVAGYQESSGDILLPFIVAAGHNCIPWNSKDGNGKRIIPNADISVEINYSNGVTHLPLYDVEHHKNGYIVDLIRPTGPKPKLYWDDSELDAGTSIDAKVNLTGCTNSAGCHKWKDRGDNNCDDECPETINTWWYPSVISNKFTYPDDLPRVDADKRNKTGVANDSSVCSSIAQFQLAGQIVNAGSGVWTGGAGIFINSDNDVNASYKPTAAEKKSGKLTLLLSSLSVPGCPVAKDSLRIFFVPEPLSNAGSDKILCTNATSVSLQGSVSNATTGIWSGGTGTITNANALNTSYKPTAAEVNSGSVLLKLTTVNSSICAPFIDEVKIDFIKPPLVDAGTDQVLCSSSALFSLNASASNHAGLTWSGGTGTFSNSSIGNTTYSPSPSEISSGSVKLVLTATANSPCLSVADDILLSIIKAPGINAGVDLRVCETSASVNLSASASDHAGVTWSGGSGTFINTSIVNPVYLPSDAEISSGSVQLSVKALAVSPCVDRSDDLILTIVKKTGINAGGDQVICSTTSSITLNASANNHAGLIWSGGLGTFSDATVNNPEYILSASEVAAGSVNLKLTATALSPCVPESDDVVISIIKAPTADAGPDQDICSTSPSAHLNGAFSNASSVLWSGGSGSFSDSQLNSADYFLSIAEANGGLIQLTFTALGVAPCSSISDDLTITFATPPIVNAGNDRLICADQKSLVLNGTASSSVAVNWSGGQGSFHPDNSSLMPTYFPSASEIASGLAELILTTLNVDNCLPEDDTLLISIKSLPLLISQDTLIACEGTTTDLVTSEIVNTQYQWSRGGSILPEVSHSINVAVTTVPIKYFVKATNEFLCVALDSMVVKGIPVPVILLSDTSVCEGQVAPLEAKVINAVNAYPLTYSWSSGGIDLNNQNGVYNASLSGEYSVKVKIADCENAESAVVSILSNPVDQMPDKAKFCSDGNQMIELDAGSASKYLWSTSDTTEKVFVSLPGLYSVTIFNSYKCSNTEEIEVYEVCPPKLFISNSFTPNADGKNEKYNVYGTHFTNFKMMIFNRWGEIIFESNDRNSVWDGMYRGEAIPIGIYPWIITYEGDSEEFRGPYQLDGSVTIVR